MKNILNKLNKIQVELKAPKGQFNNFGKYAYRNSEDILEALKPLLAEHQVVINITDQIEMIGDRYYVRAKATIYDIESGENINSIAYAREDENKKGMDSSQLTGSTSSYARKYALNGLLAIDDNKDSDSTNQHDKSPKTETKASNLISDAQRKRLFAISGGNEELIKGVIKNYGHQTTKTITKKEYDGIVKDIEHLIEVTG